MIPLNMLQVDAAFVSAAREGTVLDGLHSAAAEIGRQLAVTVRADPTIYTSTREQVAKLIEKKTGVR